MNNLKTLYNDHAIKITNYKQIQPQTAKEDEPKTQMKSTSRIALSPWAHLITSESVVPSGQNLQVPPVTQT